MTVAGRAALRDLAERAKGGDSWATARNDGRWSAFFSTHGDPYVVEEGKGMFGWLAQVATSPEDYGRARALFMGAADPATVIELLDIIDAIAALAGRALDEGRNVLGDGATDDEATAVEYFARQLLDLLGP